MDRIRALLNGWPWYAVIAITAGLLLALYWTMRALGVTAEIGVFSTLTSLALIPFAVATLPLTLHLVDRLDGINWPQMKRNIESNAWASAGYLIGRWLGVAIVIFGVL